jgi:hypothetical protein
MKSKIIASLLSLSLAGISASSFAQDAEKVEKKTRKAVKKEMKGKHYKARKKMLKTEKKDNMNGTTTPM